jgi:hypothetical protein
MRIRVTGGPWPERIGCTGRIVTDELDPKIYPRHGLGRYETIILLDDDPLDHLDRRRPRRWSMVIDFRDVEPLKARQPDS